MEIVLGWFVFSIVAGVIASSKGRSGVGYLLLSLVLSPLSGIILAVAVPSVGEFRRHDTHLRCPDCREFVLNEARVCKHCGCRLVPLSEQPARANRIGPSGEAS